MAHRLLTTCCRENNETADKTKNLSDQITYKPTNPVAKCRLAHNLEDFAMASTTQSLPAYMDVSRTRPLLCVLGGHDLGLTVAAIAQCAGFQVVVIDDRGGRDEQSTFIDSGNCWSKITMR